MFPMTSCWLFLKHSNGPFTKTPNDIQRDLSQKAGHSREVPWLEMNLPPRFSVLPLLPRAQARQVPSLLYLIS